MLLGLVGLAMWSYVVCSLEFEEVCFQNFRPLTELGMLAMIFGGILFVVGIVLLAMWGQPSSLAAAPETPPEGKYCSQCITLNPLEAKFCNSCGKDFRDRPIS